MARFLCLLLLSSLCLGCQAKQPTVLPQGYWEGVASLDSTRFFIGLESNDGLLSIDIPEMMIRGAETQIKSQKHGQLLLTLPVGPSELRLLLHDEGGSLSGKIAYDTKTGTTTLYPGAYRKTYRMKTRPPREGEKKHC